jgi:hypothetical protein
LTVRKQINTALQSATGYRLTRETPEYRREEIEKAANAAARATKRQGAAEQRRLRAERDAARAALVELRQSLKAEKRRRIKAQAANRLVWERIDDEARRIIERVTPRTMTGTVKLFGMIEALRYIYRVGVPGQIVESGVWRGGSMQAAALTLLECHDTERELHLFDTFEGMPPPSDVDVRLKDSQTAEEIMRTSDKDARIWAVAGLDDVKQGMGETGYPSEKIFYHQGRVEETIPDRAPDQIALLRLDTDWYESTRHELDHLYDRLSPGGILIIDDYRYWQGSYRATHEWLDETGEPFFLVPMGAAAIAVKPLGPRDQVDSRS